MALLNYHNYFTDNILPIIGSIFFLCSLLFLTIQILITILLDKIVNIFNLNIKNKFNLFKNYVKNSEDSFIIPLTFHLGCILPIIFFIFSKFELNWKIALLYNIIRIGPMYIHFAYVYTMCHKEAHTYGNIFITNNIVIKNIYNYWIGLFHGVLPGTFTYSHIYNHHKHNNNILDIYSTAGYPRDSIINFMRYIVVWFFYATNISTLHYFWINKQFKFFTKTLLSTIYYIFFVYICNLIFGFEYTCVTILYPFFEGNILLSLVNFTWHMFIEENNEYINSTTILNGKNFIFSEEYHVVHHQNAGLHHSKYKEMYEKNKENYDIVFQNVNIFELGITAIFKNYKRLATMVKNPNKNTAEILKKRLQKTLW